MSLGQVAALAVAAVLGFWMLGAYNRLVALRNAVAAAVAQVDDAQSRRADTLLALTAALRAPMVGETVALDTLQSGQAAVTAAVEALRLKPLAAAPASVLAEAEARLSASADRVLALLDGHPDTAGSADIQALLAALNQAAARLDFARRTFNEASQAYNEAAQEFPTRLLTRLYGFGAAGRI
ncbi:MAG: LemA family protein [Rubrivivax sp.]|nr:LemA family protein [Rubrivivax sp.]